MARDEPQDLRDDAETLSGEVFTRQLDDATETADETDGATAANDGTTAPEPTAAASDADSGPSEPVDRFDDEPTPTSVSSDPDLTLVPDSVQAQTQGLDPLMAELGDEGEGELSPEDQL